MKNLVLLGSTGSIGRQTLDVVRSNPGRFKVLGLAAGSNLELLGRQVDEFQPEMLYSARAWNEGPVPSNGWRFTSMDRMAAHPDANAVVVATVGREGLKPTLAALNAGKNVALANKEVIVMAGEIVAEQARRNGVEILPIDSEPSAIWQCIRGEDQGIRRIILTGSGGPFRARPLSDMPSVTPAEALNHPTWRMGRKITIDSATLMNKGMEVIEASRLFGIPIDGIEVVIHPQSIVHSMVEFADGSVKAQLGPADMRLPIQYALSYPNRWANPTLPRLDPIKSHTLTFEPLDMDRYPCFKLALEAGRKGGTYPAVLAASDEVAVSMFLSGQIGFQEIPAIVEGALSAHMPRYQPSLEDILDADAWGREYAVALKV